MKMRIAKFIALTGAASRRGADALIARGAVSINGNVISSPVCFVDDTDIVEIDGKRISAPNGVELYMFNKPLNVMTTAHDPDGRKTIYDILSPQYRHLKYVGRLDYKTTGLLLLTNNGDLARRLTLPASKIRRTYLATVSGSDLSRLDAARRGITVDGIHYAPMDISVMNDGRLRVTVTEGKKNEIRIVLRACGAPVKKLHRISFGKIELGNLSVGEIRPVSQKVIDETLKSL